MPVFTQSDFNKLKGLKTSDRSTEEQRAINDVMGYRDKSLSNPQIDNINQTESESLDTNDMAYLLRKQVDAYMFDLNNKYNQALAKNQQKYGAERNSVNTSANEYLDRIANEVSSYYKRFKGTDKLPINDYQKKELAAQYDARKATYGEDNANVWLDNQFKDIVGNNQSWWEQGLNAIGHLAPAIEGGAIQAYGMVHGAINHILGTEGYNENPDLNWWDSFMDDVLDNPVTRYGRDVELAGASNVVQGFTNAVGLSDESAAERIAATKASATRYNPEGIGADAIVTTQDQDDAFISSATPWQALQSGGFTALSMLVGAGEAQLAGKIFSGMAKGAKWLNSTGKALKTAESLEKALVGIKRAQNVTDMFVIPAAVGTMEGGLEGLSTKIDTERKAVQDLDDYYRNKVDEEVRAILADDKQNPMIAVGDGTARRVLNPNDVYKQVWDKYQQEYIDSRRQIEWASSKAGIHNFYANSLINGAINQALKAGLMAPRVQETLRNSRAFGWAYKKPKFNIADDGVTVTPKMSKAGIIGRVLKEPAGEGLEEYMQSLSNDVFSGAAENNINEFIKNKFEGDGTVKIADSFGSDYAAALTALKGSLTNKESIQSAILGAVSSTMGTVGGIGRGYHRDEKGNLVRNSLLDPRNLTRGLDSKGNQESWFDYARRVTPWRSGAINAYFDRRQEMNDAKETAATMTEWLKDPQNKAKWDGLQGTGNWITQMENAAESNDQFSYRKAQMGKAINDIFMLKKLEGTDFHEAIMTDLQKAANGELTQEEIAKMRQNGGEEYQNISDQELVEKVQSNANKMLGLMTQVENESKSLDRLLGRVDEDTKQSLIFGKIMEQDFRERRDQLQKEIDTIKSGIQNSRNSNGSMDDDMKGLILKYGSLNKALKVESSLQEQKEKTKKKIEELEAIDPKKTSDKQKEELLKSKKTLKAIDRELESLSGLRDENGQVDSSLAQFVLNEQDIMNLDPVTRAIVLAQGAAKLYNATHQNRQRVDQLNLEIDEINHQMDVLEAQKAGWLKADGKIKKGHNKQYERNTKKIAELQKQKDAKMRALDAEQGKMNTKPIYNSAQQEVIDNLVQQGMAQDADFLNKVVDMGRLEKGIKDYHTQYQAILSDPKAFQNYVQRAKYNAQRDLTRRRAERIANIQNFQEYSQELDRLTANASQQEINEIFATLRSEDARQKRDYQKDNMVVDENTGDLVAPAEQPKTNYDRYMENTQKQGDLIRQFAKKPYLTANDQSLLIDAMQYLLSKGVDVTDREAAVEALIEKDEQGNQGGKFRQFVEAKNDQRLLQQRISMPVFTSIGEVVGQYVDIINGRKTDAINRGNMQPTVQPAVNPNNPEAPAAQPQPTPTSTNPPSPSPSPAAQPAPQPQGPSLFDIGGATPEAGHFVDGDGTVATDAQAQSMQQRQQEGGQEEEQKSTRRKLFETVTTPEIAKMVDGSANLIENSNEDTAVKNLAAQYLDELAVNGDNNYPTLDDLLTDIQAQVNRLRNQADMQEKEENDFNKAAGLLQGVYNSLSVKKIRRRGRSAPMTPTRPANPRAAWIHTANIAYMEQQNPDAWAVRFTNDHAIDEWNRNHTIDRKDPVYFITDSEWNAEVTMQMNNGDSRNYDTLTDMPIVAAVRVETPQNPANTTAIEIGGLWYQPIGIMPGSKAKSVSGAALTEEIRRVASKEQGRHLVTATGLPNGQPLITHVYGVNYLTAHHPDASGQTQRQNAEENNSDIIDDILMSIPRSSEDRLRAMSKEEMLADPEYQEARSKFLNGLQWNGEGSGIYENQLTFTPDNYRQGETGNPMIVFRKPMAETTSRNGDKTLPDVLANGTPEQVVTFNSRTERLFNEVIRPLFQYLPLKDRSGDKSAKLITQTDIAANPNVFQDECGRLAKMLNGFDGSDNSKGIKGISDFIYINPRSGWSVKVTAPEGLQTIGTDLTNSESVYKIFFVNNDPEIAPIEIGTITMNPSSGNNPTNNTAAMNLLRNIIWDGQKVRDFLNWQVPKADAQNLKNPDKARSGQARRNYAAIVDDGILTLAGSSIVYDVDGVKLYAPITTDGQGHTRIVYPADKVINPDNAQPSAPQNITPQGDGAIIAGDGSQVLGDSGVDLGDANNGAPLPPSPPRESESLRKAKETTRRIIEDSKELHQSKDGTYYYVIDKNTGKEVKYLRVTTVIGADESVPQWTPTVQQIYDKLREKHTLAELDVSQVNSFADINYMSKSLNIPVREIKRAIAELRTAHKKEKYGAWGTPSTSIGNSFDNITRDFLAGHLKVEYPNVSQDVLNAFVEQLTLFKNDLDSRGIHIVSEGVKAHGTITIIDDDENTHDVKVAGTLDLFGYDDNGNFYIFDMKTTRKHTDQKLQDEKAKWSRQISMYADLLKQTYGIDVTPNHLRIIPINVSYPTPMGKREEKLDPTGPAYSETDEGQLQMQYRGHEPEDFKMPMPQQPKESNGDNAVGMRKTDYKGQFQPGYTRFNINWDNLSSEDQDIASTLITQAGNTGENLDSAPHSAHIETPQKRNPNFMDTGDIDFEDYQEAGPTVPPIVPYGQTELLPQWRKLSAAIKGFLADNYGVESVEDYNDMLNDPALSEAVVHDLKCHGLM